MATTTDKLEQIRLALADLPDRLAKVITSGAPLLGTASAPQAEDASLSDQEYRSTRSVRGVRKISHGLQQVAYSGVPGFSQVAAALGAVVKVVEGIQNVRQGIGLLTGSMWGQEKVRRGQKAKPAPLPRPVIPMAQLVKQRPSPRVRATPFVPIAKRPTPGWKRRAPAPGPAVPITRAPSPQPKRASKQTQAPLRSYQGKTTHVANVHPGKQTPNFGVDRRTKVAPPEEAAQWTKPTAAQQPAAATGPQKSTVQKPMQQPKATGMAAGPISAEQVASLTASMHALTEELKQLRQSLAQSGGAGPARRRKRGDGPFSRGRQSQQQGGSLGKAVGTTLGGFAGGAVGEALGG